MKTLKSDNTILHEILTHISQKSMQNCNYSKDCSQIIFEYLDSITMIKYILFDRDLITLKNINHVMFTYLKNLGTSEKRIKNIIIEMNKFIECKKRKSDEISQYDNISGNMNFIFDKHTLYNYIYSIINFMSFINTVNNGAKQIIDKLTMVNEYVDQLPNDIDQYLLINDIAVHKSLNLISKYVSHISDKKIIQKINFLNNRNPIVYTLRINEKCDFNNVSIFIFLKYFYYYTI